MQKDGLEWRIEMSNGSIPKDPVMQMENGIYTIS